LIVNNFCLFIQNKDMSTNKKFIYIISFFVLIGALLCFLFFFYNLKYPVKYKDTISFYSKEYNLDKNVVSSIINEESSFNSRAISSSGAIGLMQIMPSTAKFIANEILHEEYNREKLFLPETNIKYGCCYLNYLNKKFNGEKEVLCAYNAGEGLVRSWLNGREYSDDGKTLSEIPYKETNDYYTKVMNGKKHYVGRV